MPEMTSWIVTTPQDIDRARELIREYAASLGCSPCLQNIEAEMANFPGGFASPSGGLLLVRNDGEEAGVVGVKRVDDLTAEMARLYVLPRFRGLGLGRLLAQASLELAQQLGYRALRLYTLPAMAVALRLYRQLGFRDIPPYGDHPVPGAVYLEKNLETND